MIWGLNLCHLVNLHSGSTGPRSDWCEQAVLCSSLIAGQKVQASQAERVMLLWLSVCSLRRRGQKQEGQRGRGEREVDFRKGGRGQGKETVRKKGQREGARVARMWVLRLPEARKSDLANVLTLRQEVQVAACLPRGNYIPMSWRVPDPFLEGDNCPTLSTICMLLTRVLGLL